MMEDIAEVWEACLERIRGEIHSQYISTIIQPLRPVSLEDGTMTLAVPSSFAKDVIESRYLELLSQAISEVRGTATKARLTVSAPAPVVEVMAQKYSLPDPVPPPPQPERQPLSHPSAKKYTFENFVVGDSNKFAYNAAMMVAERPGSNYNPLFIHGGTGLGKTHLLYAIEDYSKKLDPNIKVRYVQTSVFIDEFIAVLTQKGNKAAFDQKYINNKIVMFDDIQALSGTDAIQNKFFDIFNLLYGQNSHIVLSSDRPPSDMSGLSDRIQSRFEGGLRIDINPPDLETRLAILRMKSHAEGVEIPDDAMIYIASKVNSNIRTLEGLLNRVVASARLYGMRIDLPMVQDVLKDQVAEPDQNRAPTVDIILGLASSYYDIAMVDLVGKNRSRQLVHGRQVAMYLCRELTSETLISVGTKFGGRDHSTVLHSCRKIEAMIKQREDVYTEVRELTNMINRSEL